MSLLLTIETIHQEILVRGHPTDKSFDLLFPPEMQKLASEFWSPTAVSFQVAKHLCSRNQTVLDVGSGSGKFCLIAALLFPETHIVGVEHRPSLVAIGRFLQKKLCLKNLEFKCQDAFKTTWSSFDSVYLFNPFEEQTYEQNKLNYTDGGLIALDSKNYDRFGIKTKIRLNKLREGTKVAIYNGFHKNYALPDSFDVVKESVVKGCQLVLGKKKATQTLELQKI